MGFPCGVPGKPPKNKATPKHLRPRTGARLGPARGWTLWSCFVDLRCGPTAPPWRSPPEATSLSRPFFWQGSVLVWNPSQGRWLLGGKPRASRGHFGGCGTQNFETNSQDMRGYGLRGGEYNPSKPVPSTAQAIKRTPLDAIPIDPVRSAWGPVQSWASFRTQSCQSSTSGSSSPGGWVLFRWKEPIKFPFGETRPKAHQTQSPAKSRAQRKWFENHFLGTDPRRSLAIRLTNQV